MMHWPPRLLHALDFRVDPRYVENRREQILRGDGGGLGDVHRLGRFADDLVHFEAAVGEGQRAEGSPMVAAGAPVDCRPHALAADDQSRKAAESQRTHHDSRRIAALHLCVRFPHQCRLAEISVPLPLWQFHPAHPCDPWLNRLTHRRATRGITLPESAGSGIAPRTAPTANQSILPSTPPPRSRRSFAR